MTLRRILATRKAEGGALLIALMLLLAGTGVAHADESTYNVDLTFPTSSVTGTITTDGTTGTVTASDIVSWSLTITDPYGSNLLTNTTSGPYLQVDGADLTTNGNELLFNYSGTDQGDVWFEGRTPLPGFSWGLVTSNATLSFQYPSPQGTYVSTFSSPSFTFTGETGNQVIGTVPEPPTYLLTLIGLAVLVMMRNNWFRRVVESALN
jgi:dipeptidyl aminopeptidase/acylaminoacyl peptidase